MRLLEYDFDAMITVKPELLEDFVGLNESPSKGDLCEKVSAIASDVGEGVVFEAEFIPNSEIPKLIEWLKRIKLVDGNGVGNCPF